MNSCREVRRPNPEGIWRVLSAAWCAAILHNMPSAEASGIMRYTEIRADYMERYRKLFFLEDEGEQADERLIFLTLKSSFYLINYRFNDITHHFWLQIWPVQRKQSINTV